MAEMSAERDEWMRRTGPLYPLLIAAKEQTGLPLAGDLEPTDGDRRRALPWIALVGLGLGVVAAGVAAVALDIGMAPVAAAAVVAVLIFGAGGFLFERGAASAIAARWSRDGDGGAILAAVFAVALVSRVALLAGVREGFWTAALVVALVASRAVHAGALLLSARLAATGPSADDDGEERPGWGPIAAVGAVMVGAVGVAAGFFGVVALLCAAPLALAGAWLSAAGDRGQHAAGAALVAELLVLAAAAAVAPAAATVAL